MAEIQLGVVEARYADIIWEHEPVSSSELVKLTEEAFHWKRTTAHNVLRRLCDKGLFRNLVLIYLHILEGLNQEA